MIETLGFLFNDDAERTGLYQEVLGVCLDRSLIFKKYIAFLGDNDRGKTVAVAILCALLGRANYSTSSIKNLATNRFEMFQLYGKLANIVDDEYTGKLADDSILRRMTGGADITFEQKRRDPITDRQLAKIVSSCNALPELPNDVESNYSRAAVLAFDRFVPPRMRNPQMLDPEFWRPHLSGLLNWALDGLARVRDRGGRLASTVSGEAALSKHRRMIDNGRLFLEETYEPCSDGEAIANDDILARYLAWCVRHAIREQDRLNGIALGIKVGRVFRKSTSDVWPGPNRKTIRGRVGIRLRDEQSSNTTPSNTTQAENNDPVSNIRH